MAQRGGVSSKKKIPLRAFPEKDIIKTRFIYLYLGVKKPTRRYFKLPPTNIACFNHNFQCFLAKKICIFFFVI